MRSRVLLPFALVVSLAAGLTSRSQAPDSKDPPAAPPVTLQTLSERLRALEDAGKRSREGESDEGQNSRFPVPDSPVPDYADGLFAPFSVPRYPSPNIGTSKRLPLKATFGPGFLLESEDSEFSLQIHYESQIEGRYWQQSDQLPANNGIFLPRQRIFFNGNITKSVEYEFSINRGLGGLNLLNAYLNFHFDDQFEFRVGRYFTPFTYDQYAVSNYWLLTPERSVFTTNLSPNRQFGAMAWGYLLDKSFDYAAGVFNGSRNSFENPDSNLDAVGFVNFRPFQNADHLPFARFFNVGTSVAFGRQVQSPVPVSFRIGGGSPDANIPGNATVPFLLLNPGVSEQGDRLLGSVHAAYFYKGLSVIGEWQYGFGNYVNGPRTEKVRVPYSGYYLAAGYFLTGEEVERRTRVKPLRPVFPTSKDQRRGIGAWELAGRVAQLRLGEQVFSGGLANRDLWSNSATTTELGMNWYLNEYLKVYTFWMRGEFGDKVQYRPDKYQKTADMLWVRAQLYF